MRKSVKCLLMVGLIVVFLASVCAIGKTVIEFWSTDNEPDRVEVYEDVAARFMAENPDIEVQIIPIEEAAIAQRIAAAAAANELPDILRMGIERVSVFAADGLLDEDAAEEALSLIEVEYEILPAVFDPEEAMKEGAPQIHEGPTVKNNVSETRHIEFGHVDEAFGNCDYIREDDFDIHPVSHAAMEPHNSVATYDLQGRLTIWTSTQVPYYIQILLAQTLGMKEGDIRVIRPHVGGGWGGKMELFKDQYCAAHLSMVTGKPVKIEYTREEEFAYTRHRTAMKYVLKTGFNEDGTLVAKECRTVLDGGAYNAMGPTALYLTGFFQNFPYTIPNYRYDGYHVYTNKSPSSAMRGFGGP